MSPKPRILCVDDEPMVIDAISDNLRRDFIVVAATSGAQALELLAAEDIDVIVSDMRMPVMNGATLLARARERAPDVPRILLTGQADIESAIAAVNTGQLFRFLTKPCDREQLRATLVAAVEHRRLLTAERELLEKTLHGSVAALVDILSMTNPVSFGRANRIKARVVALAGELALASRWQVEMAAMLQPIAYVTLPDETAEKLQAGHALSIDEKKMVARLPTVTEQLLGHIPRLDDVRAILASAAVRTSRGETLVELGAAVLRAAGELEDLGVQGQSLLDASEVVCSRTTAYPKCVLDAIAKLARAGGPRIEIREVTLAALRVGMVFADDVRMRSGTLLVAHGYEVTASFVERVRNFPDGAMPALLRIAVTVT